MASRDSQLMTESVSFATKQGGFDVGFGGLVDTQNAKLTAFAHTIGHSIDGLIIQPGEGLGGRVMTTRAPGITVDYLRSSTITHRYEREVAAEQMVSIAAVPIVVRDRVRAILYGGFRVPTQVGSAPLDALVTAAQRMKWEMTVRDEVERRLREILAEQTELRVGGRYGAEPNAAHRHDVVVESLVEFRSAEQDARLTVRETDVLVLVALGMRNAHVAEMLHLQETTVKAYVSSAMHKLGAESRYQAVILAKAAGLIP